MVRRRGRMGRRRAPVVVLVVGALLAAVAAAGLEATTAAPPAAAATVTPGQDDGVRITPVARIVGALGFRELTAMATDGAGNVYVAGYGWDSPAAVRTSRFITTTGTSTDLGGAFLVKMAADGTLVWSASMGTSDVRALKVDTAGDVFVTGLTTGTFSGLSISEPGLPAVPRNGPYAARLTTGGTAVWAAPVGFDRAIGVDPSGTHLYVAGTNDASPMLVRVDPANGATLWQRAFYGEDTVWPALFNDVTVLPDGSPVAVGYFGDILYLDWPTKVPSHVLDHHNGATLAVRYDLSGTLQWYRQLGGVDTYSRVRAVTLPDGNVAVASKSRWSNAQFGGVVAPPTGYDFAFTAKLVAGTGAVSWVGFVTSDPATSAASNPMFDIGGLAVDASGNISMGTGFTDRAIARGSNGTIAVDSPGFSDVAASWTSAGALRFARPTSSADVPGQDGTHPVTRELQVGAGGDLVQAGLLGRPVIGYGGPNALTMAPEVSDGGIYIARLRPGGGTRLRPPEPPTFVKAWTNTVDTTAATAITVWWKPPADTGGSPITSYRIVVRCRRVDAVPPTPDATVNLAGPADHVTISGLPPNGCTWQVVVRASNANGNGAQSAGDGGQLFVEAVGLAAGVPAGGGYTPLGDAVRIMDTRDGTGPVPVAKLGPGQSVDLMVDRFSGAIGNAAAVALNVTAVLPSTATHLTIWPTGTPLPPTSNLNVAAGTVVPNFVVAAVGTAGKVSIRNNSGNVDVIVDMVGWWSPYAFPTNNTYVPLTPFRLLDTRDGTGAGTTTPLGANGKATFAVAGRGGVPAGTSAKAVVVNLTGTGPTQATHLTLSPSSTSRSGSSNLNLAAGQTAANLAIATIGVDGSITVWNNSGAAHAIVDVVGYFRPSAPDALATITGGRLRTVAPIRALDTRDGTGMPGGTPLRLGAGTVVTLPITSIPELQLDGSPMAAVVLNLTGVLPSQATHVTVWPGDAPLPVASSLNLAAGDVRANLVIAKVGGDGTIKLRNNSGQVDLLVDIVGYLRTAPGG